ncbi:hypothetical protein QO200_02870 [Flavobacterium sp. Arc3]
MKNNNQFPFRNALENSKLEARTSLNKKQWYQTVLKEKERIIIYL